jgi:hypothetical protein
LLPPRAAKRLLWELDGVVVAKADLEAWASSSSSRFFSSSGGGGGGSTVSFRAFMHLRAEQVGNGRIGVL